MSTATDPLVERANHCGVAEHFQILDAENLCGWPQPEISYGIAAGSELPGIAHEAWKLCADVAMALWAEVCGIIPIARHGDPKANIVMTGENLGGPYGVLADSYLVRCGLTENKQFSARQRYDTSESWWSGDVNQWPQNTIALIVVIAHEVGHALGLSHLPMGNLMQPSISRSILKPQRQEIDLMRQLYGPPVQQPPAPPPPTPTPPPMPPGCTVLPYGLGHLCFPSQAGGFVSYHVDDPALMSLLAKRQEAGS